jgi:hypothetical protein
MADMCGSASQQASEVNAQNFKAILDTFVAAMQQSVMDNQQNARAWNAHNLTVANDAQKIKHLAELGLLQLTQTGATENQQTVSPAGTAASEAIKGGVGVSGEQVAANVAAMSDVAVKLAEALIPAIVEAVKGVVATAPPKN